MTKKIQPPSFSEAPLPQSSLMPRYYQIASLLAARIRSGNYAPGSRLGNEVDLSRAFHVSRITIRSALAILSLQGLVVRRRALGTFVADLIEPSVSFELNGFLDDILVQVETARTIFYESDELPCPSDVAGELSVRPGSPVVRLQRLRVDQSGPKVWLVNYLPCDVGRKYAPEAIARWSLLGLLDSDPATHLGSGRQRISACGADNNVARRLEVSPGAPLLFVERTVYSTVGRPLEFVRLYYPGSRYSIAVSLSRMIWH